MAQWKRACCALIRTKIRIPGTHIKTGQAVSPPAVVPYNSSTGEETRDALGKGAKQTSLNQLVPGSATRVSK